MSILGVSAFHHDSAAAIIKKGKIIGACQEERFTRIKYDKSWPKNSIDYLFVIISVFYIINFTCLSLD